jgi:hypothetical protein
MKLLKKLILHKRFIFLFILILAVINSCSFYMINKAKEDVNSPLYLKVISNYTYDSHKSGSQWKDIAIEFDRPIKFGKSNNGIKLLVDNLSIPITTRINNKTLYIHPNVSYSYNKKYSVKITSSSIAGVNKSTKTTNRTVTFTTYNITNYNTLGLTDFMASAKEFYDFMINNYPFLNMTKTVTGFDFQKNKNFI